MPEYKVGFYWARYHIDDHPTVIEWTGHNWYWGSNLIGSLSNFQVGSYIGTCTDKTILDTISKML